MDSSEIKTMMLSYNRLQAKSNKSAMNVMALNDMFIKMPEIIEQLQAKNKRLREVLDYDKRKLSEDITALLVESQFAIWVEESGGYMTAMQVNGRKIRAIDYYLQRNTDPEDIDLLSKQNRFHHLIDGQSQCIMRIVEQALKEQP